MLLHVLLLRPQVWKCLALLGAESYKSMFGEEAPGMSLSLEVPPLAACLRGQQPESESLSWLCLSSKWIEALLVTMRFLRTQIRNCKMCLYWDYKGLLLSVVLALGRPEKALWWLLSPLPRCSFCVICGNELEGLALVAWGQKSLFPHWPILLLAHILAWWQLRRDILVVAYSFLFTISTSVRTVLSNVHRHM